jgi:hypothetical protein
VVPETLKQLSLKVSQYFLDFLESDFKRQQAPRRRVILQTSSGFKAGMALAGYRSLRDAMWGALGKPWDATAIEIAPRVFTRTLSQPLQLILKEQVAAVNRDAVQAVIVALVQEARHSLPQSMSHPEEWVETLRGTLADHLGSSIVRPMLAFLDTALKDQAYSSIDSVFNAEGDLIATLAEPLDEQLPEILARLSVSRDTTELMQAAARLLNLDFVKAVLSQFFASFAASDAFLEFRDLETYVSTSEGNQLYLYIGSIKYSSAIYPVLYLPIDVKRDETKGTYTLKLTNQLYAHKRATDYLLQELSARAQKQWLSPIPERINYLHATDPILESVSPIFTRITKAFGLLDEVKLGPGPVSQQSDSQITISNSLYFCAFEKADEALLNDYEEMISQVRNDKEGVVTLFQAMIEGVISGNPISIDAAIERHWNALPIDIRAVPDTPIPLNEEQQKILQAIRHDEGRLIVVEGPPGTGKSHTIVAIAADCAARKKSCLVLSDKAEALEVVYTKLSNAMNEVRGSDEFPNPLLRLGTEHANFRKLTSASALAQVGAQVKATMANRTGLQADRDHRRQTLRDNISAVIKAYGAIKTSDIQAHEQLAQELDHLCGQPLSGLIDGLPDLPGHPTNDPSPADYAQLEPFVRHLIEARLPGSGAELETWLSTCHLASTLAGQVQGMQFADCPSLKEEHLNALADTIYAVEGLRRPVIGWLFCANKLGHLAIRCQEITTFRKTIEFPVDLEMVKSIVDAGRRLVAAIAGASDKRIRFEGLYDTLRTTTSAIPSLVKLRRYVEAINRQPDSAALIALYAKTATSDGAHLWVQGLRYFDQHRTLCTQFGHAPHLEYVARKTEIERLNTALMNAEVDSRLVSFVQNAASDAKVLAKLIRDKQKFPEEKFEAVREAFPVMIASIREFGELMPLKKDLLDVLVIDEASQVSVAQAFPALLRARKIVVMGDSHQFANTKSSNASTELNQKHRGELEGFFRREVSNEAALLERLSYFDVKRSVLEFGQLCTNYRIMLRKHFRSYKELIHYSSSTFYGGQLQAIKIRNVPLTDCIEFNELVVPDLDAARNTNPLEAKFILDRCLDLLDEESPPTVGVITPFREQQSYISHLLGNDARYNEFRARLKIKVMTFDSCQGEERHIIFYSMVATRKQDLLNYIFPVSLQNAEELIGEKLKMQRLNVGFSRAQEMVSFVLSKPVIEFKGSIGQALRHFQNMQRTPTYGHEDTDPQSPMERKVLDWIYATPFYQLHVDAVEVLPQFPLGEYLRQLDPSYKHPSWRVDFLVTIDVDSSVVYIVIEYDGFEYHFKKGAPVNVGTHERYLNEADVERQLTLESYGYRFLRLNRFNLGADPVAMLSARLEEIVAAAGKGDATTGTVKAISEQAQALTEGTARACSRCGTIKPMTSFFDKSLRNGAGGTGRICAACKEAERVPMQHARRRRRWN